MDVMLALQEQDKPGVASMQTYGRLHLDRTGKSAQWVMQDVPPHVRIKLKAIFQKLRLTETKAFHFPNISMACADLEWFVSRYPMVMTPEDRRALEHGRADFEKGRQYNEEVMLPEWKPPARYGFKPGKEPYLGQKQATELLHRLKRLLVLDDVGLGKTWIALYALAGSEYLPAAIVVQSHMPSQWIEEFIEPLTYMSVHRVRGRKPYKLPPANLYIFTYSNIGWWADIGATGFFKAVVFDEIQELRKGEATNKGRAAKIFAENAVLKCGLSASPIYNYGSEIFSIVELVEPGALGTWEEFRREWCIQGPGDSWLVADPEALGTHLREMQLLIRRERQGRKVNKVVIQVDWDDVAAQEDDAVSKTLAIKVLTGSFHESGQAARELDMRMRMMTGIAKARPVAAYARVLLEAGTPVVLFGWHREVYKIWLRELADFKPLLYTGTESPKQKDRTKKAFIEGGTNLVLMSLRSGAGLDGIQARCSTVLFGELDWTPKVHDPQCIGRVDRPGQKDDEITAVYFWTNGGADPLIMSVHGVKADQARGIVDPLKGVEKIYSDESRIKLLAKNYLERHGVHLAGRQC
jgi:hypothetical protein